MAEENQSQSNPLEAQDREKLITIRTQITQEIDEAASTKINTLKRPATEEQLKTKQYLLEKEKIERNTAVDLQSALEQELSTSTEGIQNHNDANNLKLKIEAYKDKIASYDTSISRQEKEIIQLEMVHRLNNISRTIAQLRRSILSDNREILDLYSKNAANLANNFQGVPEKKDQYTQNLNRLNSKIEQDQKDLNQQTPRLINLLANNLVVPQKSEILQKWRNRLALLEQEPPTQTNMDEKPSLNAAIDALTNINHESLLNTTANQSSTLVESDYLRLEIIANQLLLDERKNEGSLILNPRTPEIIPADEYKHAQRNWESGSSNDQINTRIKSNKEALEKIAKQETIAAIKSGSSIDQQSIPTTDQSGEITPPLTTTTTTAWISGQKRPLQQSTGSLQPFTPRSPRANFSTTESVSNAVALEAEIKKNNDNIESLAIYRNNLNNKGLTEYEISGRLDGANFATTAYMNMNGLLEKQKRGEVLNAREQEELQNNKKIIAGYEPIKALEDRIDKLHTSRISISDKISPKVSGTNAHLATIVNNYPTILEDKKKLEERPNTQPLNAEETARLAQHKSNLTTLQQNGLLDLTQQLHSINHNIKFAAQDLKDRRDVFLYETSLKTNFEANTGRTSPPGFTSRPSLLDQKIMLKRIEWVHQTCPTAAGYQIKENFNKSGYEVTHPQKNITYSATHDGVKSSNTSDECLNLMAKDLARCYVEKVKAGEITPGTTDKPDKNNLISLSAPPDVEKKFTQAVYQALAAEWKNLPKNDASKNLLEHALNKLEIKNTADEKVPHPTGFPSTMTVTTPDATPLIGNTRNISQRATDARNNTNSQNPPNQNRPGRQHT